MGFFNKKTGFTAAELTKTATPSDLGVRYSISGYKVRTWNIERNDIYAHHHNLIGKQLVRKLHRFPAAREYTNELENIGFFRKECKIGQNEQNSNPNFILNIYENREWNKENWEADGRFVLDFSWPFNSNATEKNNIKECFCTPRDLKKLADFIHDFAKKQNSWGLNSTQQLKNKNQSVFKSKYIFNYKYDNEEYSEIIDFKFHIRNYNFGNKKFETFKIKVPYFQYANTINQPVDIIMTSLQLKEFANFIYDALDS